MTRRHLTLVLVAAWLGLCVWSVLSYQMTAPSDFGFTRGLNRVYAFLDIQIGAVVVAAFAFALSFRLPPGSAIRWVARIPALATLAVVVAFAALVAFVIWKDPASTPPVTERPVTKPVDR